MNADLKLSAIPHCPGGAPFYTVRQLRSEDGARSVTVLGPGGVVEPIDLMVVKEEMNGNKSINTLVAACYDLRLWFEFLHQRDRRWDEITWNGDELLSYFVAWLRYGDQLEPSQRVIPIEAASLRSEKTISRVLSSLYSFYDFHFSTPFARSIREYSSRQLARQAKKQRLSQPRPIRLKLESNNEPPKVLSHMQLHKIKAACLSKRDQLLISLMGDRGLRLGQVLGLRHSDWQSRLAVMTIVPRTDNANGARAKTDRTWTIPVNPALMDLHAEYMYDEYMECMSDYLFVNLYGTAKHQPLTFSGVRSVIDGLRHRSGVEFHPHMLRHTFATHKLSEGVPIGVIQAMLTHKSAVTTSSIYTHLDAEVLRTWIDAAECGQLPGGQFSSHPNLGDPETVRHLLDGTKAMR